MLIKKFIIFTFSLLICIFYTALPATVAKGSNDVIWDGDQVLGQSGAYDFAGIYEFDNLIIGDDVEITNKGISQLVIKVNGTLKLGKNASIRVRNGFYPNAPASHISISGLTESNINNLGTDAGGFRVYPYMFGQGGNGGSGGSGLSFPGGGGGGGYGGGSGGPGGTGGSYTSWNGQNGQSNGGNGGDTTYSDTYDEGCKGGTGGGATSIGSQGGKSKYGSSGGGGNGGTGGDSIIFYNNPGGGGGGGYGGGVLSIIANNLIYDVSAPPRLLVSGQNGGAGGTSLDGKSGSPGSNGQGGLIILNVPNSSLYNQLWNLKSGDSVGGEINSQNGGHGTISGDPLKVFINGLEYIPSSGITIPLTLKVPLQGTRSLNATVSPSNATIKNATWSSDDSSYASVDSNGVVTGNRLGTTTIKATSGDNLVASCAVTVVPKATSVIIDKKELWLTVNSGTTTLNATVTPTNALNWVTWKSSDEAVATVDAVGTVRPLSGGMAVITATSGDGGVTDTCRVNVSSVGGDILVTGITISDLTVPVGTIRPLQVIFQPSNATNKNLIWSSDDLSIASVDSNGVITGIKLGTTKINVKTVEGGFTSSCTVTVTPTFLKGDVNSDGKVTIMDTVKIARSLVGLESLTDIQKLAADYNNDNKVTIMDAQAIARYLVSH